MYDVQMDYNYLTFSGKPDVKNRLKTRVSKYFLLNMFLIFNPKLISSLPDIKKDGKHMYLNVSFLIYVFDFQSEINLKLTIESE